MYLESKILDFKNAILSKIQDKLAFLTEKSYILSNIDHLLFFSISVSIVISIFFNNSVSAVMLCVTSILYILTLLLKKGNRLRLEKSTLFLMLYFLLAVASTINSTMPHASMIGLSKTILYLIYYFAVLGYLRDNKDKIPVIAGIVGICVSFEIIVAFMQNSFDVMSAATWQDTSRLSPEQILTRVYGTLKPSNPNLLGGFLIAAVPFLWQCAGLSFVNGKKKQLILYGILSVLAIPAIFMTGCRGAYIALFAMLFLVIILAYKICKYHYPKIYERINKHKKAIIAWIIAGGTAIIFCIPKISNRILSIFAMRNDSSTSFRMNVYNSSIEMFRDNFLLGIGVGNKTFREIYGLYMLSGFDALSAYCVFLEIAVESGIFALIFYLLFVFYLIKAGVKAFNSSRNIKTKIILAAGILSIAGVMVHGLFDTIYFRPQVQLIFWVAVSIITVCSDITSEFKEKSAKKIESVKNKRKGKK